MENIDMLKYRAWDIENKKMYKVLGFNFYGKMTATLQYNPVIRKGLEELEIMKRTGLYDDRETPIWESDVIEYKYDETSFYGVVEFWSKKIIEIGWEHDETLFCGFILKSIGKEEYFSSIPTLASIKVVGNIYSNPELLEN